jgi:hypothetical protein
MTGSNSTRTSESDPLHRIRSGRSGPGIQVGGRSPGEDSHSVTCAAVSVCRACRNNRSRCWPGGGLPLARAIAWLRVLNVCRVGYSALFGCAEACP